MPGLAIRPAPAHVIADERFFVVRVAGSAVARDGWTAEERDVMTADRWWSPDDLARTSEVVYPGSLPELVRSAARSC